MLFFKAAYCRTVQIGFRWQSIKRTIAMELLPSGEDPLWIVQRH